MTRRYRGRGGVVRAGMHVARRCLLPLLAAGVALLGACGSDDGGGGVSTVTRDGMRDVSTSTTSVPDDVTPTTVVAPPTSPVSDPGFTVTAAGFTGWGVRGDDGCSETWGQIADADGDGLIVLQVTGTTCQPAAPLNGNYGNYRTEADVRATSSSPLVTPVGAGIAFSQTYTECTNSCTDFVQPVLLVTLDTPPDPEHPTLTLIGVGDVTAEQVAEVAAGLQAG